MSIRIPYACLVTGHKRDRSGVWWDGLDWRGNCAHCGKPMIRYRHVWRLFAVSDENSDRKTRSRSD